MLRAVVTLSVIALSSAGPHSVQRRHASSSVFGLKHQHQRAVSTQAEIGHGGTSRDAAAGSAPPASVTCTDKNTTTLRCPDPKGVCCPNRPQFCCPEGYTCASNNVCVPPQKEYYYNVSAYRTCKPVPKQLAFTINEDGNSLYFPYFAHQPIQMDTGIEYFVFVIHGANRNADDYFCAMDAAADLASVQLSIPRQKIAVIAPHFMSTDDNFHFNETLEYLHWAGNTTDPNGVWRKAFDDVSGNISSFAVFDKILQSIPQCGNRDQKCNVTVVGHSSGGQYVQRYALAADIPRLKTNAENGREKFIVANPSSFCYFDGRRPNKTGSGFVIPDDSNCTDYNDWEWGLAGDFPEYINQTLAKESDINVHIENYLNRKVVYLAGLADNCTEDTSAHGCPDHGLETTCADELEGPSRIARAKAFWQYVKLQQKPLQNTFAGVPGVGHDHIAMFQSPVGMSNIFAPLPPTIPPTKPPSPSPPTTPSPTMSPNAPTPSSNAHAHDKEYEDVFIGVGAVSVLVVVSAMYSAVFRKRNIAELRPTSTEPEYSGF